MVLSCGGGFWGITLQYLGNYSNACGTASCWQVDRAANFLGNLAGWIAPVMTGLVVDKTGRFFWAFIITAVIALLGRCPGYLLSALFDGGLVNSPGYADSR